MPICKGDRNPVSVEHCNSSAQRHLGNERAEINSSEIFRWRGDERNPLADHYGNDVDREFIDRACVQERCDDPCTTHHPFTTLRISALPLFMTVSKTGTELPVRV